MAETDKQRAPPMPKDGGPTPDQNQMAARNRRAVRTEDLSEEEIAAIEASEMEAGFEHLDAELDQAGMSVVDVGLDFARKLRARGDAARGRPGRQGVSRQPVRRFLNAIASTRGSPGPKSDRKGRALLLPEEGRGCHGTRSRIDFSPAEGVSWGFRRPRIADLRVRVQPYR